MSPLVCRLCGHKPLGMSFFELDGTGACVKCAARQRQATLANNPTGITREEREHAEEAAKAAQDKNIGRKDDGHDGNGPMKLRYGLLPPAAIRAVVRVLSYGAKKYGDRNWALADNARNRYYDAAQRHLTAWWEGEAFDQDTGESHLAHAACCVLFLLNGIADMTDPSKIRVDGAPLADLITGRAAPIAKPWPSSMCGYKFKTGALCGAVQGHLGEAAHETQANCAAAHGEPPVGQTWCKRCKLVHEALSCGCPCLGNGPCHKDCGCPCPPTCWCWSIENQNTRHKPRAPAPPEVPKPCATPGCTLHVGPGATLCVSCAPSGLCPHGRKPNDCGTVACWSLPSK